MYAVSPTGDNQLESLLKMHADCELIKQYLNYGPTVMFVGGFFDEWNGK